MVGWDCGWDGEVGVGGGDMVLMAEVIVRLSYWREGILSM